MTTNDFLNQPGAKEAEQFLLKMKYSEIKLNSPKLCSEPISLQTVGRLFVQSYTPNFRLFIFYVDRLLLFLKSLMVRALRSYSFLFSPGCPLVQY